MIRSPGTLEAVCDKCGTMEDMPVKEHQPFPLSMPGYYMYSVLPETLRAKGWFTDLASTVLCPACANVREGK